MRNRILVVVDVLALAIHIVVLVMQIVGGHIAGIVWVTVSRLHFGSAG